MYRAICYECDAKEMYSHDEGKPLLPHKWRFGAEAHVKSHVEDHHDGSDVDIEIEEVPDDAA